jgi:hypothetical protein
MKKKVRSMIKRRVIREDRDNAILRDQWLKEELNGKGPGFE